MLTMFVPSSYEAHDLIKMLAGKRRSAIGAAGVYTGKIEGADVRIAVCGMGQPHSARRIEAVLEKFASETEPVFLVGFAGGLDTNLKREDLVYLAGDVAGAEVSVLEASRVSGIGIQKIFSVFTSEIVIDTPATKIEALEKFGAPIVDMETGPFLELLKKHNRAGAVIRVISDDAEDIFPADLFAHGYDFAAGKDTPFRMAWHLARHPGDVLRLRKFVAPLPACRARLSAFVRATVRAASGAA